MEDNKHDQSVYYSWGTPCENGRGIEVSMVVKHSKTKSSFYRRIYVAYLIDDGVNSVPAIIAATGMPRRTVQDTITALKELSIDCEFIGGKKNGSYQINDWGAISKTWVKNNLKHVLYVLDQG